MLLVWVDELDAGRFGVKRFKRAYVTRTVRVLLRVSVWEGVGGYRARLDLSKNSGPMESKLEDWQQLGRRRSNMLWKRTRWGGQPWLFCFLTLLLLLLLFLLLLLLLLLFFFFLFPFLFFFFFSFSFTFFLIIKCGRRVIMCVRVCACKCVCKRVRGCVCVCEEKRKGGGVGWLEEEDDLFVNAKVGSDEGR